MQAVKLLLLVFYYHYKRGDIFRWNLARCGCFCSLDGSNSPSPGIRQPLPVWSHRSKCFGVFFFSLSNSEFNLGKWKRAFEGSDNKIN